MNAPSADRPLRGHLLAMPVVVLNMGIEMVFVLEQRLRAQSIAPDKARRVLVDVVRALLVPAFLREIFRPQVLYSSRQLRTVFETLAHASIMRLNTASMAKLYELMLMGAKLQCVSASACGGPLRVPVNVTQTHLETLKEMLAMHSVASAVASSRGEADAAAATTTGAGTQAMLDSLTALAAAAAAVAASDSAAIEGTVSDLIDAVGRTMRAVYGTLPAAEVWALHSTLLSFFQDRRIRVSIFLSENLQTQDGQLILPEQQPPAPGAPAVGSLKYFDAAGKQIGPTTVLAPLSAKRGTGAPPAPAALGRNVYASHRTKPSIDSGGAPLVASMANFTGNVSAADAALADPSDDAETASSGGGALLESSRHGRVGMNFLSTLVGRSSAAAGDPLPMDFAFDDASAWNAEGSRSSSSFVSAAATAGGVASAVQRFDGSASAARASRLAASVHEDAEARATTAGGGEHDDLLSMLDAL